MTIAVDLGRKATKQTNKNQHKVVNYKMQWNLVIPPSNVDWIYFPQNTGLGKL